jgi:hypothetical protein
MCDKPKEPINFFPVLSQLDFLPKLLLIDKVEWFLDVAFFFKG